MGILRKKNPGDLVLYLFSGDENPSAVTAVGLHISWDFWKQ